MNTIKLNFMCLNKFIYIQSTIIHCFLTAIKKSIIDDIIKHLSFKLIYLKISSISSLMIFI